MGFSIDRNGIRLSWGGKNQYFKMPSINGVNPLQDDTSQILNPESMDVYNIFSTTAHLKSVIGKRGELLATGDWQHVKRTSDGETIVENSPIIDILGKPNPLQNGNDYDMLWNENRCVFGNTYEYIVKPIGFPEPSMLNLLPPADMETITTGKWFAQSDINEIIESYKYCNDKEFTTDEINHMWIPNSKNPLIGESPLKSLYMAISNIRASMKFRNTIMAKKGALGILSNGSSDGTGGGIPLTTGERQRMEKEYQSAYGIGDDQMQLLITNSNLSYQAMSYPTRDLLLFEEVEDDFQQICMAFGMHRHLFPTVNGATFENQSEALKQTYETTIFPLAGELALNRTKLFGLDGKKEYLRLSYDHVPAMQEDKKEEAETAHLRAKSVATLIKEGFTPNQITSITGIEF